MGTLPYHLAMAILRCADVVCICRAFRIMDDDGSRTLNFEEFKKGLHDFGVTLPDEVRDPCLSLTFFVLVLDVWCSLFPHRM